MSSIFGKDTRDPHIDIKKELAGLKRGVAPELTYDPTFKSIPVAYAIIENGGIILAIRDMVLNANLVRFQNPRLKSSENLLAAENTEQFLDMIVGLVEFKARGDTERVPAILTEIREMVARTPLPEAEKEIFNRIKEERVKKRNT